PARGHGASGRQGVHHARPHRHPEGAALLPPRRDPAVRAADAAEGLGGEAGDQALEDGLGLLARNAGLLGASDVEPGLVERAARMTASPSTSWKTARKRSRLSSKWW